MTDIPPAARSAFLLPVGHDLGPHLLEPDGGGQAADPYEFWVRVGPKVSRLGSLHFAIWLLAHDGEAQLPDRARVLAATAGLGIQRDQAEAALADLLDGGLLVEVTPEPNAARRFAETHQLMPLMVGLGPDGSDPGMRVVGLLDIPVVQVSTAMYELWMWAHLRPSLWLACVEAGSTAGAGPDRVLAEVLSAVHPLLASRAAYLDVHDVRVNGTVAA